MTYKITVAWNINKEEIKELKLLVKLAKIQVMQTAAETNAMSDIVVDTSHGY
jgi:hypothetical protein